MNVSDHMMESVALICFKLAVDVLIWLVFL